MAYSEDEFGARTWNGAPSLSSTGSARVDFFYGVRRNVDPERVCLLAEKSLVEDRLDTLKICAYARDCRSGKGEREVARILYKWLADSHPGLLLCNLELFVGTFGRLDDYFALVEGPLENEMLARVADQLRLDLMAATSGNSTVSLMAKWVPSEKKKADRSSHANRKLAAYMGLSPAQLRKTVLSPLREHLKIVERNMCANEWGSIEYNQVPSRAMLVYGDAFFRHDTERFAKWRDGLATGSTKVNAGQLFPYEVVGRYLRRNSIDPLLEAQWKTALDEGREMGELSRTLVMVDASGSMTCGGPPKPILISFALGLLISELTGDQFKHQVLTFETEPAFHTVRGTSLFDKIRSLQEMSWDGSTDLDAAMQLILDVAKQQRLPPSQMPNRLVVVSDMQFDEATSGQEEITLDVVDKQFKNAGYERPHVVFWNVQGAADDFQSQAGRTGVSIISGFSTQTFKCVLAGEEVTPYMTMREAIDSPRYDGIRLP